MRYSYYPGCSLGGSAVEYDRSTRALLESFGAELNEIPDWTCCGASAVESVSGLLSYVLPARNLALAQKKSPELDVLAPCSACYLNLLKVGEEALRDKEMAARVNEVPAEEGLGLRAKPRVRHLLDVLVNDIGWERLAGKAEHKLEGISVAPYYGCQALRPYPVFDDPERPQSMDALIRAAGAEIHDWDVGGRCCGASLMATKQDAALDAVGRILAAAKGADVIVTVCPMCQMNLEAYQSKLLKAAGLERPISILYLPQLLGLALGLESKDLLLEKNLCVTGEFMSRVREKAAAPA